MTADFRFAFVHPDGESTVSVDVERHPDEWTAGDFDRVARLLVVVMRHLGDAGPFRWCLIEASQRDDVGETPLSCDWALLVQGRSVHTSATFVLRSEQLPVNSAEWKSIS